MVASVARADGSDPMTRGRIILLSSLVVVVLIVAALVVVGFIYRPMLRTGTGYAAHNACAVHFLTARPDPRTDLPPNPLVPYLRTSIDDEAGTVTASVLGVGFRQTAYVSEHGCALGDRAAGAQQSTPPPALLEGGPEGIDLPEAEGSRPAVRPPSTSPRTGTAPAAWWPSTAVRSSASGTATFDPDTRQLGWSTGKSAASALVGRAIVEFPDADLDPAGTGLRPSGPMTARRSRSTT